MQRIAWFTPLTPGTNGPPFGNLDLITGIARHHTVDVFTDSAQPSGANTSLRISTAHDFVWRHVQQPYDLTVYEIADTSRHGFVWPYLVRYPGLLVLHDDRLHRLRSDTLRQLGRPHAYRSEFRYCHPAAAPVIPTLLPGLLGATGDLWPMRRLVLECSRLVVVDSPWRADELQQEVSHDRFRIVRPGVTRSTLNSIDRAALRAEVGIPEDSIVFASFGRIAPSRRIREILRALSTLGRSDLYVLACGTVERGYDPHQEAALFGLGDRFFLLPAADDPQWLRFLPAADVALCLEWPDGSDATMPWLHCLAHGLPIIVTDRANRVEIPTVDPRGWHVRCASKLEDCEQTLPSKPAAVSIDIIDEVHSLWIAARRLARDDRLRTELAEAGTALWRDRFRFDQMLTGYLKAIHEAQAIPVSAARPDELPSHLLDDRSAQARSLLESLGLKYALET